MNLEPQQIQSYTDEGFLLLSDAIDAETVERARQVLTRKLSNAGKNPYHAFVMDRAVRACFTEKVREAAAELAGVAKRFRAPWRVYTITVLPTKGPWEWPSPHIDHAREEDGHLTFPPAFRIACLIFLSDVQPHSGATIVWPGSHRRLQGLARSNVERYKYMASVQRDISKADLGVPKEIIAEAGDVLLYHYLCAHSGSSNTSPAPRFALSHKW
jgi:hypothetical protein